jgi:hypothetical protein
MIAVQNGIINVSFLETEMVLVFANKASLHIPLENLPEVKALTQEQKNDFEVIDGEYVSFLDIDTVYHVSDLLK